ncbi:glycosyltransferase [Exiguobacterium sp. ERU656]|uniref:glycosyltransferase n=1 Tax=Exiguobacterium sp. ERU656 TaxID=2751217 RepID=UPI001BEC9FF5|nr:glycosyltransferase [Exiguobacterium sp. ERU656]
METKTISLSNFLKDFIIQYQILQLSNKTILKKKWNKEILFITKFPPIVGGVASQEFWRARLLAMHGYHVRVITNSNEANMNQMSTDWNVEDLDWINFKSIDNKGSLTTYFTDCSYVNGEINQEHRHIPMSNMAYSKLVGLGIKVAEKYESSVILSGYLEPYGSVANRISQLRKIPHFQHFAGSDLERLSKIDEVGFNFKNFLERTNLISTSWDKFYRLLSLNVPITNLSPFAAPTILPSELFCEKGRKLYQKKDNDFIVGMYGKYSKFKNIKELLLSIKLLNEQGEKIKVYLLLTGVVEDEVNNLINEMISNGSLIFQNALPPWRISEFIRSCDVICLLENNFPVQVHSPITPLEIGMNNVPILFSQELYQKIRLKGYLDQHNCEVVDNPKDYLEVANKLLNLKKNRKKYKSNLSDLGKLNIDSSLWMRYINSIDLLVNNNFLNQQKKITFPETILTLYSFFPLSIAILKKEYDYDISEWCKTNINEFKLGNLNFANKFSKILTKEYYGRDLFFDDCINYESSRINSVFERNRKEELLEVNNINVKKLFFVSESRKIFIKLKFIPQVISLNTNIVEKYDKAFFGEIVLEEKENENYLFLVSNGMSNKFLKIEDATLKFLNLLENGVLLTKKQYENNTLLEHLDSFNYLETSFFDNNETI